MTKKLTFYYSEYHKSGGVIKSYTISFNRFSKTKNRRYYREITPSLRYFVHVNRLGMIKMRGVQRVS